LRWRSRLRRPADHRIAGRHGNNAGRWRASTSCGRSQVRRAGCSSTISPGRSTSSTQDQAALRPTWISTAAVPAPDCSTSSRRTPVLASGFISFEFDPDYARNGRFYTIHLEETALPGSLVPDNQSVRGLDVSGYTATAPIPTPGPVDHEGVLIEWTDSNIADTAFEGRARELLRIPLNSRIHPLGDISFNPAARPGDADWRVLYVACGDGGSGDSRGTYRLNPQRWTRWSGRSFGSSPTSPSMRTTAP
jgi:hypothetical protein